MTIKGEDNGSGKSGLTITRVQFGYAAGFLVHQDRNAILIDAGTGKTIQPLLDALAANNLETSDLKLILLTHTHYDHSGGAAEIKELTGAPLAVHRNEAPNLEAGYTTFPKGTRWKGKLMVGIGRVFARSMGKYAPVKPDIIIENKLDLAEFGIPGVALHTPGHTSGSVSVFLEDGCAFGGDNLFGTSEKKHYPPFANDKRGVLKAWETYVEMGAKVIYPAHGRPVKIEALKAELPSAKIRYAL